MLGPAPDATHKYEYFREGDNAQMLDDMRKTWGKFGGWAGDWHTHPIPGPPQQSPGDLAAGKMFVDHYKGWKEAIGSIIICRWQGDETWGAWFYNENGCHQAEIVDWNGKYDDYGHVEDYRQKTA